VFQRPTLPQLIARAQADIEARLPGSKPQARRSLLGIFARQNADAAQGLYGYISWVADQILPDTADSEWLERHAFWKAGLTPVAAVASTGNVTFSGTNGAIIDAGTQLQDADGEIYTTDAAGTIVAGTATVAITAQTAGAAGNLAEGTSLTLVSPVPGVQSQAPVAAGGLTGGADKETSERLLARLANVMQTPPQGGTLDDYVVWALAAHPNVTRAWSEENTMGAGTVVTRFMTDGATANGIPDAGTVATVQAYIDARRPAGLAGCYVAAPIADALDMTIQLAPNTSAVQLAAEAEIADVLLREAEPGGTILISHLNEAISLTAGETDHLIVTPAADITHTAGHIAVPGAITWQALP
jgi:uncharacterized phage protein gp47/JayE